MGEVARGEVGLGPVEDAVEARAIVGDEGEEEGVGLALAGGAVAGGVVDDAALVVDRVLGVGLPEGPGGLGGDLGGGLGAAADGGGGEQEDGSHDLSGQDLSGEDLSGGELSGGEGGYGAGPGRA